MTPELQALALRAAAALKGELVPGVRWVSLPVAPRLEPSPAESGAGWVLIDSVRVPDLSCPATVGALRYAAHARLERRHGRPARMIPAQHDGRIAWAWVAQTGDRAEYVTVLHTTSPGTTTQIRAEAIVLALETAP